MKTVKMTMRELRKLVGYEPRADTPIKFKQDGMDCWLEENGKRIADANSIIDIIYK